MKTVANLKIQISVCGLTFMGGMLEQQNYESFVPWFIKYL